MGRIIHGSSAGLRRTVLYGLLVPVCAFVAFGFLRGQGRSEYQTSGTGPRVEFVPQSTGPISALTVSPDSKLIVAGVADGIILVDGRGVILRRLKAHAGGTSALAFSPKGDLFASGGRDSEIRIWSASGELLCTGRQDHGLEVTGLTFDLEGRRVISVGIGSELYAWDTGCRVLRRIETLRHGANAGRVSFAKAINAHPAGFIVGGGVIWQKSPKEMSWGPGAVMLSWHDFSAIGRFSFDIDLLDGVNCISFTDTKALLATAGGHVAIFAISNGRRLGLLQEGRGTGHSGDQRASMSADGRQIAVIVGNGSLMIRRDERERHFAVDRDALITRVTFAPNGKYLLSTTNRGDIRFHNLDGEIRAHIGRPPPGVSVGREKPWEVACPGL